MNLKSLIITSLMFFSGLAFADINWTTYSDKALMMAQKQGQQVVLGFHKKGCGTCAAQDAELASKGINDAKNTVFLIVQRKNSSHQSVYQKYGFNQRQWAAIVLLDASGNEVARVNPGTTRGASLDKLVMKANGTGA